MGQTPPLSIQNGPSKGFHRGSSGSRAPGGFYPPWSWGVWREAPGLRRVLVEGGEGDFSLSPLSSVSPHPFRMKSPFSLKLVLGSAFMSRGGSDPPCRRYQRGEKRGPCSLSSPLWFTRQGGGPISPSKAPSKSALEGGMGGLRFGDGGSDLPSLGPSKTLCISPGGLCPGGEGEPGPLFSLSREGRGG
jgi:hypothetical protein